MNDYLCPKCRGQLRVGDELIFSTKTEKGQVALVLLSPKIGDYHIIKHPSVVFEKGEHVDFFCPLCHTNLAAKQLSRNLARVLAVDARGNESALIFSEIVGEHCTYRLSNDKVEAYGQDASHYMNFFGESPRHYH